ncbi:hypothetical protein VNI00_016576 [Paramarasmius palmivorus]|uniref:F-box domain-containing protein n=1 Tax=Paramarasmius palmivorus TaxID=297713 RepID=A0AAW0BE49_9AGAR
MRNILNLNLPLKSRWKRQSQLILDPLDETRPGRPLPHLPPELWVLIIRYASTLSYLPSPEQDHEVYNHSVQEKLSFSLVSKRWSSYTAEVLYEFIWITRARQAKSLALTLLCQVCASPVVHPSSYHHQNSLRRTTSSDQCGRYIRRLKIATSTLDRCDPADIRVILDYAVNLESYEDHRSVRRNSEQEMLDPRGSPEALLAALGKNALRRLSWTCYGLDSSLSGLSSIAANLEYLELSFCGASSAFFPLSPTTSSSSSIISSSGFSFTTTTTSVTTHCTTTTTTTEPMLPLSLPALRTLVITPDNSVFLALSEWDMPQLSNLTINLGHHHTMPAFHTFFQAHGIKITHLELGYAPTPDSLVVSDQHSPSGSTLYQLAPNLKEFICSAYTQTEWNWENPDWVAPHPLLTSHPELEYIGIRDLGREVRRVWSEFGPGPQQHVDPHSDDESPFFMLLEQLSSLFSHTSFPKLKYIRDLSEDSDGLRRGKRSLYHDDKASVPSPAQAAGGRRSSLSSWRRPRHRHSRTFSTPVAFVGVPGHLRMTRFWGKILDRAGERGVYVEDWRGLNVTRRDLERWARGLGDI